MAKYGLDAALYDGIEGPATAPYGGINRKTKRELREEELVSLMPDLECDPAAFSDTELDGLISMAIRKADQDRPRRHRRLR